MSAIRQILVVVDPGNSTQACVGKAARLALAFGARLDLLICDTTPRLAANHFYAAEFCETARGGIRAGHCGVLETLAGPIRQQGTIVGTDVVFCDSLHTGIIDKVRKLRADLVVKDTHYHGYARRASFSNADWHLIRECPAPLMLTKPIVWRSLVRVAAAVDPGHADDKPATLDHELLLLAERLSIGLGGEARAVHVVDTTSLLAGAAAVARAHGSANPIDTSALKSFRHIHEQELDRLIAQHPNFVGHTDVLEGAPATALPEYAAGCGINLLVMGAVARGALQALLVGRTAERVLDRLPCDLLIWKPSQLVAKMLSAAEAA